MQQDNELVTFTLAIERGLINNEIHMGATSCIVLSKNPSKSCQENIKEAVEAFRKKLKGIIERAVAVHNENCPPYPPSLISSHPSTLISSHTHLH